MLSRKNSSAGVMSAACGGDRARVGERLQAALAGLQELHLLRDRQSDMVSWALKADREAPVTFIQASQEAPQKMGAEEQRLEATLTALKQQLSRLRKQDVGLKTHLQQLDQQINDLKLDVSKASTEQMESDSRPSSGFYELSDGGSCSLSNSCTSVYSECLSSSQTSLLLPPMSPATSSFSPPLHIDASRRRSADESTSQPTPPRASGVHLGSSRIRASTCKEQGRPRPVSTGDLDRVIMAQGPTFYKAMEPANHSVYSNLKTFAMDPKFKSNLVSRGGNEVYNYPSPLHAVALQSPIFSAGQPDTPAVTEADKAPPSDCDSLRRAPQWYDTKTIGYIDKLVQRSFCKIPSETATSTLQTNRNCHRKPTEITAGQEPSVPQPVAVQTTNIAPPDHQKRVCATFPSQDTAENTNHQQGDPETSYRYPYPAGTREYSSDEVTVSSLKKNEKVQADYGSMTRSQSDHSESRTLERRDSRPRQMASHSSSTEESQSYEHTASPQFVHAEFVPAETQRVKLRQADRKTRAVKLRRKTNEKPRASRQQHGYSSGEKPRDPHGYKGEQRKSGKSKVVQKSPTFYTEERKQGYGPDSSAAGVMYNQKVNPKQYSNSVCKPSKSRRQQYVEYEQPPDQRRKRHGKWPCDAEMYRGSMTRSVSAKPGQWMGPARPFHSSLSTNSFFSRLNARYPPAPFHVSSNYPPRCESEYSAECASLFHSTIAESSEGEMSDNTTNRFGDSESSQSFQSLSDSDSSLSLDEGDQVDSLEDEGDLVWADAAMGPTAAGHHLPRPEPSACRIKASRALKKKIRRFQPASLKVMTLV
ncbi:dapper homolog 2 [Synchiropus picturatus]